MRQLLFAAAFFAGCANASPTEQGIPRANRDLGGHLQFDDLSPGGDLAQNTDFSTVNPGDMTIAGADLAGRDLASASDMAQPRDMAQPPPDLASAAEYPIYVHTATTLYRLNPDTWALTTVGTFDAGDEITDIAIHSNGGGVAFSRTRLYELNISTGKTNRSACSFTDLIGATFLKDGTLLVLQKDGELFEIVSYGWSGIFTSCFLSGWGNVGATPAGDIQAVSDGTMYGLMESGSMASATNNAFTRVSTSSGVSTAIGATGSAQGWGLAWSRGKAIMVTGDGKVVTIDPATGAGTVVRTYTSYQFYGAGTNPLVSK